MELNLSQFITRLFAAAQAADAAGEITNELLSRMGSRLAVKYRE